VSLPSFGIDASVVEESIRWNDDVAPPACSLA
jgi:hypothetical protein